jgi:hypothetical protein
MLEEEIAKTKNLLAEMGRNQEKFQMDLEIELREAHSDRAEAVAAADHAAMATAQAARESNSSRLNMDKMEKELAFLRETLVTRPLVYLYFTAILPLFYLYFTAILPLCYLYFTSILSLFYLNQCLPPISPLYSVPG